MSVIVELLNFYLFLLIHIFCLFRCAAFFASHIVKLHIKKQLQNYTKSSGETLRLRCDFGGVPNNAKVKITWLRNEASLEDYEDERIIIKNMGQHATRLRISDLAFLDSGFYSCRAESLEGYGTAESSSMVQIRPSPGKCSKPKNSGLYQTRALICCYWLIYRQQNTTLQVYWILLEKKLLNDAFLDHFQW